MSRICVTGPRTEDDEEFVRRELDRFHRSDRGPITELGEGEATGVDSFARDWAIDNGIPVVPYKADWDRWGDAAGCIRNGEMLDDFKPDFLLVFPRGGPGTTNCAKQARKKRIERVFIESGLDPFEEAQRWG